MNPIVITRAPNGVLTATGVSSFPPSPLSPLMGWDYVAAQIAFTRPEAQALKPGESVTIDLSAKESPANA